MDNASKLLLIVGAIVICAIVVGAGLFVVGNTQDTATDALTSMSTQEIEAHNVKYSYYEGSQSGANIKSLIGILIANSNTNKDENIRVPGIYIQYNVKAFIDSGIPEEGSNASYKSELEEMRRCLDPKHNYWVETSFQNNGLIDYLTISYSKEKPVDLISRK